MYTFNIDIYYDDELESITIRENTSLGGFSMSWCDTIEEVEERLIQMVSVHIYDIKEADINLEKVLDEQKVDKNEK